MLGCLQLGDGADSADLQGQVAVARSQRVQEILFVFAALEGDLIAQLIDAAHLNGLDGDELLTGGVFGEDIVEQTVIVEVLGDIDLQLFLGGAAERGGEEDQPYDAYHSRAECRRSPC